MTDAELVRRTRDGHPAAFDQLVRRWSARVLAVCHARISRRAVAEELAQESLLRAYAAIESLEAPEKFGAWVRGIAVRVCLDWRKAKQSSQIPFSAVGHEDLQSAISDTDEPPEREIESEEASDRLLREVEQLPEDLRETILLYYFDELTYDELASLLGVSRATVNARLAKARGLLRQRLAPRLG